MRISPISENGQIRYFEIVKIAIVVLSFFALFSYISEYAVTLINTLYLLLFIESILFIASILLVINECNTIIALIQSLKIKILSYKIKDKTITILVKLKTVITLYKEKYFIKLNVLRC